MSDRRRRLVDVKTATEVTAEKLRGGFYTPPDLVQFCLKRAAELAPDKRRLSLLEPSIGDGGFIRGIAASDLRDRIETALGFEILDIEAEKSRQAMRSAGIAGTVRSSSVVTWASESETPDIDVAVGNPPFLRFQFVSAEDREGAERLAETLGLSFRGVSNLWIPVLLGALNRLRPGGAFAFVIPTECFTGCAAQVARDWLLRSVDGLHFDLFPPGSFPGVLQEITVMSGIRSEAPQQGAELTITEHDGTGRSCTWTHAASAGESWTRYLLDPEHLAALAHARELKTVTRLGQVVAFEVSIVTGANDFFSVSDDTLEEFDLRAWALPLLPRLRHAEGLVYDGRDQEAIAAAGASAWLLDFGEARPDPELSPPARRYLRTGEQLNLQERYKCRIRTPWYRIPNLQRGELMLSKRSHAFPKVIVNAAQVLTTDTIYRGRMLADATVGARSFSATFHNSLTLLTAEIEGRSFGGGVLELVPSEVGRLSVPLVPGAEAWLTELDAGLRSGSDYDLVAETDDRIVKAGAIPRDLLDTLSEARSHMLARRMDRNAASATTVEPAGTRLAA